MKPERVLALILIAMCAPLYMSHTITVMRPNDPTGYAYAGMQIAAHGLPSYTDQNDALVGPYFSLNAFKVRIGHDDAVSYLNYPPGLPLILAASRYLLPVPSAVYYVVPCLAMFGIAGTFALGNLLLGPRVGLLSAVLLAFNPTYLRFSTETWSDVPAAAFMMLGSAIMIVSARRHSMKWGLVAGGLLGYAILIRYPSALVLLPLSLYLWLELGPRSVTNRGVHGLALSFGLLMLALLLFNKVYYGGFLTTAYSAKHGWAPWRAFSIHYMLSHLADTDGGGLLASGQTIVSAHAFSWPLILFGFLLIPRRTGAFLAGVCVAFIGLYSAFKFPPEGINSRFLITVFPAIAIMIAHGAERIVSPLSALTRPSFGLVAALALTLAVSLPPLPEAVDELSRRNEWAATRVRWTIEFTSSTPANAVFLCSEYDDLVRLYGRRSALNPTRVAVPNPSGEGYDEARFEPALIAAVDTLLSNGIPVYYIDDRVPEHMRFMQVYDVLCRHYDLRGFRDKNPTIYEVNRQ